MNFQINTLNEKQIHHQLCLLMGKQIPDRFSQVLLSQDCWVIMSRLKVLIFQYFNESMGGSQVNMQRLYEHVNEKFFSLKEYYEVLSMDTLLQMHNFFQIVILPIVEFYVKQWNALWSSYLVENVYMKSSDQFSTCLCPDQNSLPERSFHHNKICYKCGEFYHNLCFNARDTELYECPFCFLKYCLPDRQVVHVFFKGYLPPVQINKSTMSIIEIDWPLAEMTSNNLSIELRCVRINKQNNYQQTWPEHCDIYLDDLISMSFKPLPQNSPLKRRHDSTIPVSIGDLVNSQKIKINQFYTNSSCWHLITAFVVIQKNQDQIFHSIIQNPSCQMDESDSKNYIKKLFLRSKSLQAEKLKISNKCQFYSSKIKHPCRSRHCTTHYQPFDLYNFVCSSIQAKSSTKRWKCPICGVRAYDIVQDTYLQKIFEKRINEKEYQFYYEDEKCDTDDCFLINDN